MTNQNYCMVNLQTMLCENVVLWDGNRSSWNPAPEYLMLVQGETMAKVWTLISAQEGYVLAPVLGQGQIGFLWDGEFLITQEPPPQLEELPIGENQPVVEGAQTL